MCFFNKPVVILEEIKNERTFFVQKENKTLYLYIMSKDFSENYCSPIWIANLCKAPKAINYNKSPFRLSQEYCKNPLEVEPSLDIKFQWIDERLDVLCSNKVICVVTDPFGDPKAYNVNIIGKTRWGNEIKFLTNKD